MSLSTIDNDQYVQIGKLWQEVAALKSKDVSLQSQVISNNRALNELADDLQALDARVRSEITDLKVWANKVNTFMTNQTAQTNFELGLIGDLADEITGIKNYLNANPPGGGGGFQWPNLGGILGPLGFGLSTGAIAALGIGAFILLGGPRKLLGRR